MKEIWKTIIAFLMLLTACILLHNQGKAQSKFDTSIYKQVVIKDINRAMVDGYPGYVFTVVSDTAIRYAYFRRITREDKSNWENGTCLLLSISQWNDLLKNKK